VQRQQKLKNFRANCINKQKPGKPSPAQASPVKKRISFLTLHCIVRQSCSKNKEDKDETLLFISIDECFGHRSARQRVDDEDEEERVIQAQTQTDQVVASRQRTCIAAGGDDLI
jgi:hypothetical protein